MGENVPDGRCYVHLSRDPRFDGVGLQYVPPADGADYGSKPLVTCVWIAKTRSVCLSTCAAVIVGNSRGFVRIFTASFGSSRNTLLEISSYCISPGIPIVQVQVDPDFLPKRLRQKRPWLVAINALGEVYYLRGLPKPGATDGCWRMIPQTARIPTAFYNPSPAGDQSAGSLVDMDYSEVKESWEGCGMDWFIVVDWAEQNIAVGSRSTARGVRRLKRYHLRIAANRKDNPSSQSRIAPPLGGLSEDERDEWVATVLCLPNTFTQITAYGMDNSHLARLTATEDATIRDGLPGANGRLFAVGTNTGSVFVYNIRPAGLLDDSSKLLPLRTIHTDSPQITTLGLSSLVVVHGGDDGLVQAWDPLASTNLSVRTLHSRCVTRGRRRLQQHAAGAEGEAAAGCQFAARCLILDPDPTMLRGIVAFGTLVRYWDFSATKKAGKTGGRGGRRRGGGRSKGALLDVIHNDERAMRLERERRQREAAQLESRFGVAPGGAALSEEEILVYAQMVSLEAFEAESSSRRSEAASNVGNSSSGGSDADAREGGTEMAAAKPEDPDFELASRLSLQEVEVEPEDDSQLASTATTTSSSSSSSNSRGHGPSSWKASSGKATKRKAWEKLSLDGYGTWRGEVKREHDDGLEDDLELAIRLSLQEQGNGRGGV